MGITNGSGGDRSAVERRTTDQKIAVPWFNSRTGNLLGMTLRAYFSLGPSSLPLWWLNLTKDWQTKPKTVLCASVVKQIQECLVSHERTNVENWTVVPGPRFF